MCVLLSREGKAHLLLVVIFLTEFPSLSVSRISFNGHGLIHFSHICWIKTCPVFSLLGYAKVHRCCLTAWTDGGRADAPATISSRQGIMKHLLGLSTSNFKIDSTLSRVECEQGTRDKEWNSDAFMLSSNGFLLWKQNLQLNSNSIANEFWF